MLVIVLIHPVSVLADIPETEIDPMLTNLLSLHYTPSGWSEDDYSRAMLALSLYLDASIANKRMQDTFYIDSLIKDAYLMRAGVGSANISYSLVVLEGSDLLMIIYTPSEGSAEYSVTSNITKTAFNNAVQGYTHWTLDPQAVDAATDMMMTAFSS